MDQDVEQAAEEQGWRVEHNKKGHPVFYPPNKAFSPIVGSGTPGDQRSRSNLLARLKRAGLKWPWTAEDRRKQRKEK